MEAWQYNIYLEIGQKKAIAAGINWPGWCRSGRDEASAMQALLEAGPRYARLLEGTNLAFNAPKSADQLCIIERVAGNATTDFGAPDKLIASDSEAFGPSALEWAQTLLTTYWRAFDAVVVTAVNQELRKGPRGGGRDLDGIVDHVMEAEASYLRTLGWKFAEIQGEDRAQKLARLRQEILNGLAAAAAGQLPETGPRGGKRWPPRFFIRRSAWHVIDHIWEIEDRIV
jgi:hypothetical protein